VRNIGGTVQSTAVSAVPSHHQHGHTTLESTPKQSAGYNVYSYSCCKDSTNRAKYKEKIRFSFISEVKPIFTEGER
jgi:hypothetical protein